MAIARFRKSAIERKQYTVDYTSWLETAEQIESIAITATPASDPVLEADGAFVLPSGKGVAFYLQGGINGTTYSISLVVVTSTGQVKEDVVQIQVVSA
jgi:hypothetical protein